MARVGYVPGDLGFYEQMTGAALLDHLAGLQRDPPRLRGDLCARFELSQADLAAPVRAYSRGRLPSRKARDGRGKLSPASRAQ